MPALPDSSALPFVPSEESLGQMLIRKNHLKLVIFSKTQARGNRQMALVEKYCEIILQVFREYTEVPPAQGGMMDEILGIVRQIAICG